MRKKKALRKVSWGICILFVLMNIVAAVHAWRFTHVSADGSVRTKNPEDLSTTEKIKTLLTGINNPKPVNDSTPKQPFETITLQSDKKINCWYIQHPKAKGTVILFHGYLASKSQMISRANELYNLGYNTMLADFMACGNSEGTQTTIGYKEAEDVKTCYDYIAAQKEKNIILFGTSMGAASVMRAVATYKLEPAKIIIECPFGTMYQTVVNRFSSMGVPSFPMAPMLVFYGGLENGFWAFGHNPQDYATGIHTPTLLLYGEKDERVTRKEIDNIYNNLQGPKTLTTFPLSGHVNYLLKYKQEWVTAVSNFLEKK